MPTVFVVRERVPSSPFDFLARFEQSKQRVALDVGQALLMGERDRLSATVDAELRQHTLDVAPTVFGLMKSLPAISAWVRPRASSFNTSRSRLVSVSAAGLP